MGHVYVYIYMCVTYISNISIVTVIVAYNYLGLHHWNSLDDTGHHWTTLDIIGYHWAILEYIGHH